MGRGRTTTDPKPFTVAVRLNEEDFRALDRLVEQWKCSRTDALRRLLRGEQRPESSAQPEQELEIGQRVIVHVRPPLGRERDVPGVLVEIGRVRKGRARRYHVESPACSPGQIEQWNVPREMLSVAEGASTVSHGSCSVEAPAAKGGLLAFEARAIVQGALTAGEKDERERIP